jgi:hypothetical protein
MKQACYFNIQFSFIVMRIVPWYFSEMKPKYTWRKYVSKYATKFFYISGKIHSSEE